MPRRPVTHAQRQQGACAAGARCARRSSGGKRAGPRGALASRPGGQLRCCAHACWPWRRRFSFGGDAPVRRGASTAMADAPAVRHSPSASVSRYIHSWFMWPARRPCWSGSSVVSMEPSVCTTKRVRPFHAIVWHAHMGLGQPSPFTTIHWKRQQESAGYTQNRQRSASA